MSVACLREAVKAKNVCPVLDRTRSIGDFRNWPRADLIDQRDHVRTEG